MTPGPSSRAPLFAGLALVATLCVGLAAGYALGARAHMRRPGPAGDTGMTMLGLTRSELRDSLRLTPGQTAVIDRVLDEARQQADSSVRQMVTDVRAATTRAKERVRAALDEPQRARLDTILARALPVLPRTPMLPGRP